MMMARRSAAATARLRLKSSSLDHGHSMSALTDAHGVFPIAPTPFLDDGRIDFASIDRLSEFYLRTGSTGVTVLGQLGEAPKLDAAESLAVAERFIKAFGRTPVIV